MVILVQNDFFVKFSFWNTLFFKFNFLIVKFQMALHVDDFLFVDINTFVFIIFLNLFLISLDF